MLGTRHIPAGRQDSTLGRVVQYRVVQGQGVHRARVPLPGYTTSADPGLSGCHQSVRLSPSGSSASRPSAVRRPGGGSLPRRPPASLESGLESSLESDLDTSGKPRIGLRTTSRDTSGKPRIGQKVTKWPFCAKVTKVVILTSFTPPSGPGTTSGKPREAQFRQKVT